MRAWSVDFSQVYPTKLASGSDDGCVKLWSINEACSLSLSHEPQDLLILKLKFTILCVCFCLFPLYINHRICSL